MANRLPLFQLQIPRRCLERRSRRGLRRQPQWRPGRDAGAGWAGCSGGRRVATTRPRPRPRPRAAELVGRDWTDENRLYLARLVVQRRNCNFLEQQSYNYHLLKLSNKLYPLLIFLLWLFNSYIQLTGIPWRRHHGPTTKTQIGCVTKRTSGEVHSITAAFILLVARPRGAATGTGVSVR